MTAVRTSSPWCSPPGRRTRTSLTLLVVALVVYWVGDSLDGFVARIRGCETRIGAVLDILCDRFCAASFYLGLVWLQPELALPVFIYLAEFMVVDCFLSLAFLAWPVRSPNYFYVIDRPIWLWNWSKPGQGGQLLAVRGAAAGDRLGVAGARDRRARCWSLKSARWSGWRASGCRSRHAKVSPCRSPPLLTTSARLAEAAASGPSTRGSSVAASSLLLVVHVVGLLAFGGGRDHS